MPTPSNLYAEKIFSEHPLSLWALDDQVDFVSLLNTADQALSSWTITGNAQFATNVTEVPQVDTSPIVGITIDDNAEVELQSGTIINSSNFDTNKNTFNISMYFKSNADATVKLGYEIGGTPVFETFDYVAPTDQTWAFLSKTFTLPAVGQDISLYVSIQQQFNVQNDFYINNLSMGQWSETYATTSAGVLLEQLSAYENVELDSSLYAVPAKTYGFEETDGYYLASSNKLFAINDGFPIVYGAANVTQILPNTNLPSLIIPGKGFLNSVGKYSNYTAEMWIRVNPNSSAEQRIFGPIASTDGIYTNGEFITIKLGSHYGSYFVGEWGRPMLLHFRVSENTASLLLDGEQVISITTDTANLTFPDNVSQAGKSQDWLGFYSYDNIDVFDIDCVAIYGYQVPEIVAKRRFVYGQGVEFPETSNASLIGASTFIDYRVADYANNYLYPDIGKWGQGVIDNFIVENNVLKSPKYTLPTIKFRNRNITFDEWMYLCTEYGADNYGSIDLSLADAVTGLGGYMLFENFNVTGSQTKGFYGVFKTVSLSKQILFKVVNNINGSTFTATIENGVITYTLSDSSDTDIEFSITPGININDIFAVGVHIPELNRKYGGRMSRFFGSSKNLSVYVGGQFSFENTFDGRIYRFGFSSQRNINKVLSLFEDDSDVLAAIGADALAMLNHTASYTFIPKVYLNDFILEIATDSYWQDYVPLSYLAGSVINAENEYERKLNFIQLNISNPILKSIVNGEYDTAESQVKAYVTFQYMSAKPNKDLETFIYTEKLDESMILRPGANWLLTKYEFLDETIVYLPSDANFEDLAIVLHIDSKATTSINRQVKIKKLQLASQAISSIEPKQIPTRFGENLFAYTLRGVYPDYSADNPVAIYKGSTPYLYLTNNSGIKMKGILNDTTSRGIRSLVNDQFSDLYRVGAIQMLSKYYEDEFPTTPQKLITFTARNKRLSLYVTSANSDNTRGFVYCLNDQTGLPDNTVFFYMNGKIVRDLYISTKNWDMIGIQFQESLDFNSSIGYIDITGPLLVHGISSYRLTASQDSVTAILRNWSQVRTMFGGAETYWGDFLSTNPVTTWENILYIPTLKTYLIDPRVNFRLYAGTNKIIVGDDTRLRFNKYAYKSYTDIVWQSDILDAV